MEHSEDYIEPDFEEGLVGNGGAQRLASGAASPAQARMARGTLDETVWQTLKRDMLDINTRLRQVVYPHFPTGRRLLAPGAAAGETDAAAAGAAAGGCDFWAPLAFVIVYALAVSRGHALFSSLFVCCWFVLLAMALHLRLVKTHAGAAGSRGVANLATNVSLAGYCIFPQTLVAVAAQLLLPLATAAARHAAWSVRLAASIRLALCLLGTLWSVSAVSLVTASSGFIEVFPLSLCLFALSWFTIAL